MGLLRRLASLLPEEKRAHHKLNSTLNQAPKIVRQPLQTHFTRILASVLMGSIVVLNVSGPVQAAVDTFEGPRSESKGPAKEKMKQAWSWRGQQSEAPGLQDLSGVPDGDVAVAWFGERDKLTYLDISGPSLAGATLELKVDEEGLNIIPEEAELQACLILQRWKQENPMAWNQKPMTDCDLVASAEYQESIGVFVFDLTPLALGLSSSTVHGLSIEPVEEPENHFQVVFEGGNSVVVNQKSRGEPNFEPGGGSSGLGGSTGPKGKPAPLTGPDNSSGFQSQGPVFVSDQSEETYSQSTEPSPQSDPANPVAVVASPVASTVEPVTFAWVYAALVAVATFPIVTRLLAYSLPNRAGKRRRH